MAGTKFVFSRTKTVSEGQEVGGARARASGCRRRRQRQRQRQRQRRRRRRRRLSLVRGKCFSFFASCSNAGQKKTVTLPN